MKIKKHRIVIFMLVIGALGTILFFPVNIQNRYTCVFHRLIGQEEMSKVVSLMNSEGVHYSSQHQDSADFMESVHYHLHHRYMATFGMFWWISLLILLVSLAYLRQQKEGPSLMLSADDDPDGLSKTDLYS